MPNQQLHAIAYCHDNQPIAQQITQQLKEQGFRLEALDCPAEAGSNALWQGMQNASGKSILLLTDNFLKSQDCMTGALQAIAKLIADEKLIVVVADGQIVHPGGQVEAVPTHFERVSHVIPYMNHWQNLYLDLRRERRLHDNDTALEQRIEITKQVSSEIGEFLRYLRNQPSFTSDEFLANNTAAFRRLLGEEVLDRNAEFGMRNTEYPDAASGQNAEFGMRNAEYGSEEVPAQAPPDPAPATQPSLVQIIESSSEELMAENLGSGKLTPEPEAEEAQEVDLEEIPGIRLLPKQEPVPQAESVECQEVTVRIVPETEPKSVPLSQLTATSGDIDDDLETLLERVLQDTSDDENPDEDDLDDADLHAIFKDDDDEEEEEAWEKHLPMPTPDEALLEFTTEEDEAIGEMAIADRALEEAVGLLEDGKTESGLNHLQEMVDRHEGNVTLRYYYAYALARYDQDYHASAAQLQTLIQQAPHHPDANFLLGELAEINHDAGNARRYFEEVANSHPDYPNIYFRLAMLTLAHFEGQEELAAGFFKKAIEQNDEHVEAHYQLANLLNERLGEPHEAVFHFKKTLAFQPEHPFANYDIALIYHQMGERELAWQFYREATLVNPELKTAQNDAAFQVEPAPADASGLVHSWDAEPADDIIEEGVFDGQDADSESLEPLENEPKGAVAEADLVVPEAVEPTGESPAEPVSEDVQPVDNLEDLVEIPGNAEFGIRNAEFGMRNAEEAVAPETLEPSVEGNAEEIVASEEPELTVEIVAAIAPEMEATLPLAQVVLITGATSGIGKATAEIFAKNGYRLILTGRREERLEELKHYFSEKYGVTPETLHFDVRDLAAVKAAIENLPEALKNVDILINNAGLSRGLAPIHEGDPEHWEEMIDTNLKGLLYLTRVVAPGMVERRSGHIINLASGAGKEVYPSGNVYCATKFAVDALTKSMRLDLFQHNVRVSQVAPGHVEETEFAKVRFDGDEERAAKTYENFQPLKASDVAEVIYFIATRPAHVNIQDVLMFGTQQAGSNFIDRSGRFEV